jgi:hypothetical protein
VQVHVTVVNFARRPPAGEGADMSGPGAHSHWSVGAGTTVLLVASLLLVLASPAPAASPGLLEQAYPPGTELLYSNGWGSDWFQFGLYQGASQNLGPLTLAVRDNGEICVLDTVKKRVMVFRPDGTIWRTFHADTEQAAGIVVTSDGYVLLDNFSKTGSATVHGPDGSPVGDVAFPTDILPSAIKVHDTQVWVRGVVREHAAEGILSDYVLVWEQGAPAVQETRFARMPSGPRAAQVEVHYEQAGGLSYEFDTGGSVLSGVLPGSEDHSGGDWGVTSDGDLVIVAGLTGAPGLGWDVWRVTPAASVFGPVHVASDEWTHMAKPLVVAADGAVYLLSSQQDGAGIWRTRIAWGDDPGPLRPLTYGTGTNTSPVVDGDWAAWFGWEGGVPQLYACHLPQGTPFRIATTSAIMGEPQTSAGRILWQDDDGQGGQIYLYDTATRVTRKLTEGTAEHYSARLSGNRIIWIESAGALEARLLLFDLGTGSTTELAHGVVSGAQINGDWIAWQQAADASMEGAQIYLHDCATGSTGQITHDDFANFDPRVADGLVAWRAYPPDSAQDEVYAYSIATATATRLTHDNFEKYDVATSGGRVAWTAYDRKGNEVYVWDETSGLTSRLTYDPFYKSQLRLARDWVAWQQHSPVTRSTVFLHRLPSDTSLRVGYSLRDFSPPDNQLPGLSAGRLVWVCSNNAAGNVILYSFCPDQAPTPDPEPFPDIQNSPYRTAIDVPFGAGIVAGAPDGLFHPEAPLNRAQFAKMLVLLLKLPVVSGIETPFWDLGNDDSAQPYPYEYVAAAHAAGIVRGTSEHSYAPWQPISRAQLVSLVVRAADQRGISVASWLAPDFHPTLGDFDPTHAGAMSRAELDGLLSDLPDFGPGWSPWAPATRGEAASLLRNLLWDWTD